MRLFGGKIGFVGSGIHSLSSQILSKSFRNWFENRTLRGTKMERSFTSLLFSFIHLSIYTHLSLHIYPLTSYHIPHSTETENTGDLGRSRRLPLPSGSRLLHVAVHSRELTTGSHQKVH